MTLRLRCSVHSATSKPHKKRRKVIDVEQYVATKQQEVHNIWMKTKHITLLQEDREILLNPCGWLNSSIIAAAQLLLKKTV